MLQKRGKAMRNRFETEEYVKQSSRRRGWRRIVQIMAGVVVFCTTYALILPALTMEKIAVCEMEEHAHTDACYTQITTKQVAVLTCDDESAGIHEHTEDCYDGESALTCGYADFLVHSHNSACYRDGILQCALEERKAHTHTDACYSETHIHTDACYTTELGEISCALAEEEEHHHDDSCYILGDDPICGVQESEGHVHSGECYEESNELCCGIEESEGHVHGDTCYNEDGTLSCETEEKEEHYHDESCYQPDVLICILEEHNGHSHDDECYEKILTCEAKETDGHKHSDSCYEQNRRLTCELEACQEEAVKLICDKEEIILHTHEAECFDGNNGLICTMLQVLSHTHDDSCFTVEEHAVDTETLTCTQIESEEHTHTALCYGQWELTCEQEEHTHTETCWEEQAAETTAQEEIVSETAEVQDAALLAEIPEEYIVEPTLIEGTAITWAITYEKNTGIYTLRFDGNGDIPDYTESEQPPWSSYGSTTMRLWFGEGITKIGARAFRLMRISDIDAWGSVSSIGAAAFANSSIASISIPGQVKTIGQSAFSYCTSLVKVELAEGIEVIEGYAFRQTYPDYFHIPSTVHTLGTYAFHLPSFYSVAPDNPYFYADDEGVLFNKDRTVLIDYPHGKVADEYIIPDTVKEISFGAFTYASYLGKLVIPSSVTVFPTQLVTHSQIHEIYIEDGAKINTTVQWLFNGNSVRTIRFPENTEFSLDNLANNSSTGLESLTIPNGVTSISALCLNTANPYPYLESVIYDAQNAKISDNGYGHVLGKNTSFKLIIGSSVDRLSTDFKFFTFQATDITFKGENYFTVAEGAFADVSSPLNGLCGTVYVDSQGVVYSYDAVKQTATVVYAQSGVKDILIPSVITAEDDGPLCTVTAVKKDAFINAEGVESITFQTPENITSIETYAMANCQTLTSVNGKTTEEEATAIFTYEALEMGYAPFYNTGLLGASGTESFEDEMDGEVGLTISRGDAASMQILLESANQTMEWIENEAGSGGYRLLTNDSLIIKTPVGNTSGTTQNKYRVYFRITGEDGSLSITPGSTYTFEEMTATCYGTEDPYTVYLEFSPEIGGTGNAFVTALYPSPESAGGGLTVWGVILTQQEAAENAGKLMEAENGQTIQAYWTTQPDQFQLAKSSTGNKPGVVSDGNGGAKPSINLSWQILLSRITENSSAYGKDYVKSVDFTDILTFPSGVSWNPDVIEAVKAGDVGRGSSYLFAGDIKVATLSCTGPIIRNARLAWDEEQESIVICWSTANSSKTAEMNTNTLTLNILPAAVNVDMTVFDTTETVNIENKVTATVHYHYSEDISVEASASKPISGGQGEIKVKKATSRTGTPYFGEEVTYTLNVYNNGGLPFIGESGVYTLRDEMSKYTYISPYDMERMFAEQYGANLSITIANAILGQWVSVTGTNGAQSWQHTGNSDFGESGKTLTITCADGIYTVAVTDGDTFSAETAAAALQAAGYAVTADATYTCIWNLNEETEKLLLNSGEERIFEIYATFKDTFQILKTQDWPNQYAKSTLSANNTARVKNPSNTQLAVSSVGNNIKREAIIPNLFSETENIYLAVEAPTMVTFWITSWTSHTTAAVPIRIFPWWTISTAVSICWLPWWRPMLICRI